LHVKQNVQGKKFSSLVWHGAVHILLFTVKAYNLFYYDK